MPLLLPVPQPRIEVRLHREWDQADQQRKPARKKRRNKVYLAHTDHLCRRRKWDPLKKRLKKRGFS